MKLRRNSWNDFGYGTTFDLLLARGTEWVPVGVTKIGRVGLVPGYFSQAGVETESVELPHQFQQLDEGFFSLGQDASFYENLVNRLGATDARKLLTALQDFAAVPSLLSRYSDEDVVQRSLMRSVSIRTVTDQYTRILTGDLQKRGFNLTIKLDPGLDNESPDMRFEVNRNRSLPSNVHALIGANGTGKTTALSNIRWAFERSVEYPLRSSPLTVSNPEQIAGLLSISFSAFDTFPPSLRNSSDQLEFRITNIRLPWISQPEATGSRPGLTPAGAARASEMEMGQHVREETLGCLAERPERLLPFLRLLADADRVLDSHRIYEAHALEDLDFAGLSSGHKIAILMVASLVRYCEEKTLVLLDEPESHLHPPLLGALTRGLSDLMTEINGLAIVATHSPVVLQEVPRRCAWIIWSAGTGPRIERPSIETFGANLGVLTREVFDLEMNRSGYHAFLRDVAARSTSYEDAIRRLDGEIGDEAKLLLRSMIRRNSEDM